LSGHSKWASIKRKKAVNDQKRGQMFTKLIREITVAARQGGGSPEFNSRLRLAIDTAQNANMPQDNIDRAISRGTGELEGVTYEEVVYEGYGPGGVALYIETTTDNQKRTVAEVRHILEKNGGNLGAVGSVAWQFDRKGQLYVDVGQHDDEVVLEAALEAGAEDVVLMDSEFIVTTDVSSLDEVRKELKRAGMRASEAELAMIPQNTVAVLGSDAARLIKLLEALDENDDVQKVSSNADIDETLLAQAMS